MNEEQKNNEHCRQEAHALKADVMQNLGWSEERWAEFQYQQGLNYLHYYLLGHPGSQRILEGSRTFWAWWKNHWRLRDESFMECCRTGLRRDTLLQLYVELHDGRKLSGDIYPSRMVLTESYKDHEKVHY